MIRSVCVHTYLRKRALWSDLRLLLQIQQGRLPEDLLGLMAQRLTLLPRDRDMGTRLNFEVPRSAEPTISLGLFFRALAPLAFSREAACVKLTDTGLDAGFFT